MSGFGKLSSLFKLELLFKVLVSLVCTSGLIYQSVDLLVHYMRGKTVVNIEIGSIFNDTLPAITICYPFVLAFNRSAEVNPKYKTWFEEYENALKELLKFDGYHNETDLGPYHKKMEQFYVQLVQDYFDSDHLKQFPNVRQLMDNISIPFKQGSDQFVNFMDFRGLAHNLNKEMVKDLEVSGDDYDDAFVYGGQPIESIVLDNGILNPYDKNVLIRGVDSVSKNNQRKCFTLFSALDKQFRDTKIELDEIQIEVRYNIHWFPPDFFKKFYISIHSPNSLPAMKVGKSFTELDFNAEYLLTYSKLNIDRLDPSYDTKCANYDLDYRFDNFNMKSDCIASCYQNKMRKLCDLFGFVVKSPFLWRKGQLDNEDAQFLKGCSDKENFKFITQCTNQCKNDCNFKYYLADLTKSRSLDPRLVPMAKITIRHNGLPDLFVRHLPETSFISFISSFGGLLGMWLGLSIVTIPHDLTKIFKQLNYQNSIIEVKSDSNLKDIKFKTQRREHFRRDINCKY